MTKQEAAELLGKLEKFMKGTNSQVETLINRTHNLRVDLEKLKQEIIRIKQSENKIILPS